MALRALQDTLYVFRNGGSKMNFAHRISDFSYEDVMGQSEATGLSLDGKSVRVAA